MIIRGSFHSLISCSMIIRGSLFSLISRSNVQLDFMIYVIYRLVVELEVMSPVFPRGSGRPVCLYSCQWVLLQLPAFITLRTPLPSLLPPSVPVVSHSLAVIYFSYDCLFFFFLITLWTWWINLPDFRHMLQLFCWFDVILFQLCACPARVHTYKHTHTRIQNHHLLTFVKFYLTMNKSSIPYRAFKRRPAKILLQKNLHLIFTIFFFFTESDLNRTADNFFTDI